MTSMDLNALRKRLSNPDSTDRISAIDDDSRSDMAKRLGFNGAGVLRSFGILLVILPLLAIVSFVLRNPRSEVTLPFADARVLDSKPALLINSGSKSSVHDTVQHDESAVRNLLDGLLVSGFDQNSCQSRYESALYRKPSPYKPSSHLLTKLRKYEYLHKRCGPSTKSYKEALKQLKTGHSAAKTDCNYIVWISFSGLGNRILTIASAFLYALLTDRVLLIDPGTDMNDLFCEPFPNTSWFLPADFPLKKQFSGFNQQSVQCQGHMLKNNLLNSSSPTVPSYLYVHLVHDYNNHDKLFFCDDEQALLRKIPWLIMKTDNYFVPSVFLIPSFKQELGKLFPRKVDLFHHLGRYLFHPTNQVWGLITRYYNAYLARADERIGMQIRVFDSENIAFPHVKEQILDCALRENLLPGLIEEETVSNSSPNQKSKAVLITSLQSGYYETLRDLYWEHATATGEITGFFQPSHEEFQQSKKKHHNRKALAEMYLLSLTDKLVTSAWSTFGYVAQGLGGLKPWILHKAENHKAPDPPCVRAMSMEPCFHAPPFWDCKAKRGVDTGAVLPHVKHCEDITWGLKLVEGHDEM